MLSQDSFDFNRFDAIAAYFDLLIDTTKKFEVSIRSIAGPIARAIKPFACFAERIGHKPFGGQCRVIQVTAGQPLTTRIQFSGFAE
jgi:hypothetical protein